MIASEKDRNVAARRIMSGARVPEPSLDRVPNHTRTGAQEVPFSIRNAETSQSEPSRASESVRLLVSLEVSDSEIKSSAERYRAMVSAYKNRIAVLKEQAEPDGTSLSPPSKRAFLEFIETHPFVRRGRLVLMENGNLRAVWKGENGAHIGLQFLGDRSIQYVIFKQREPSAPVSRVYGRDTVAGISKQIDAFDLHSLLYQWPEPNSPTKTTLSDT